MARLHYVSPDGDVADRIRARRGGKLTALDRMLLHSPPTANGWNSLLGAIRTQCALRPDIRELAILRVAALTGADYEWNAHEPLGREAGLTEAELAVLRGDTAERLSGERAAALAYSDAMTRDVQAPVEVFERLGEYFSQREIVELTATIGAYNLVSRFLIALEVGPEGAEA